MAGTMLLDSPPETVSKRDRTAIAAQACETCRSRKSKCDEARPKCGLCTRLDVECVYREPLPTKKDKTMLHILNALTRIENKFDIMAPALAAGVTPPSVSTPQSAGSASSKANPRDGFVASSTHTDLLHEGVHLTVPHKVFLWPKIYILFSDSRYDPHKHVQHILEEGTPWFVKQEILNSRPLPAEPMHASRWIGTAPMNDKSRYVLQGLTDHLTNQYCDAYFDTFNILCPILDRTVFMHDHVGPVTQYGFAYGDVSSTLVLLVLALGEIGLAGVSGDPVSTINNKPSGFRGGTQDCPPGLEFFNEARKHVAFFMTQVSLEAIQILLLQSLYYESCQKHLDFWRSTCAASVTCQILLTCQGLSDDISADLFKRAFWQCIINEEFFHFDLDLNKSGMQSVEDRVPTPTFMVHPSMLASQSMLSDSNLLSHYHFTAMLALRRLISDIHTTLHRYSPQSYHSEDNTSHGGPPVHVIRELARQIDSWRALLPQPLQWDDSGSFDPPEVSQFARSSSGPMFSPDQGTIPIHHKSNLDIVIAQLRSRFYYARFLVYRPFIYKALHFPERMTNDDYECCGMAIKAAISWPISMAPPKNKKRLLQHVFSWTQNFIAILLVLYSVMQSEHRAAMCDKFVTQHDMEQAIDLMLEWLRDVKQFDTIAAVGWSLIAPLYSQEG